LSGAQPTQPVIIAVVTGVAGAAVARIHAVPVAGSIAVGAGVGLAALLALAAANTWSLPRVLALVPVVAVSAVGLVWGGVTAIHVIIAAVIVAIVFAATDVIVFERLVLYRDPLMSATAWALFVALVPLLQPALEHEVRWNDVIVGGAVGTLNFFAVLGMLLRTRETKRNEEPRT
jgi:hypothetical protein